MKTAFPHVQEIPIQNLVEQVNQYENSAAMVVLSEPEPIDGPHQLDVKRYGVIVSTEDGRRGLLLPNLDGVDTVEEQISIARSKGGISEYDEYQLERFEVVRHE